MVTGAFTSAERQFMNEPKSQPFIRRRYFTRGPIQKGWDSSVVPLLLCSEKRLHSSRLLNSAQLWVAPAYPFLRETMQRVHLQGLSYEALWLNTCHSYRCALEQHDELQTIIVWPCEEPVRVAALHQFPSIGKRSCRRRENLPGLFSHPNKAAIISLFSSYSIWAIVAGTPSVSSALPTRRKPSEGGSVKSWTWAKSHSQRYRLLSVRAFVSRKLYRATC